MLLMAPSLSASAWKFGINALLGCVQAVQRALSGGRKDVTMAAVNVLSMALAGPQPNALDPAVTSTLWERAMLALGGGVASMAKLNSTTHIQAREETLKVRHGHLWLQTPALMLPALKS